MSESVQPITRDEFNVLHADAAAALDLAKENNRILHAMRFWGRVAFIAKVIIWTLVLVVPVILYPFIVSHLPVATGTPLFGLPSSVQIQKALHPGQ